MQRQRAGQQRFQADGAERGFFERQALVFSRPRIVAGDDDVDQPVADGLCERDAIFFARSGGESLAKVR